MPLWIVAHADALYNFLLPLLVGLNGSQRRHALNIVSGLLVCTRLKHRTLAALTRVLRVPHAEVDNWYLKERFGLADYRVQSYEVILRWHTLVFAAYAFVQYRRVIPLLTNPKTALPKVPEILAAHQHEHLRQTACYIAAPARQRWSDAKILADLTPT